MIAVRPLLLVVLLAAPSLVSAETMSFEDATAILGKSCGADIDANCRGVNLDANRLKDCLYRNQDSMSAQCKTDYIGAFDAIQKRAAAHAAVPKMCEREVSKLCTGLPKGDGKVIGCLVTATRGVSARCNQAINDAGYR
ncbi:MAG: hypothetical protein E7813_07345 [Bradyrhizobium sp.]|uniref:hypothetical protein n=1 Tax=Bradyrhizobium sp. TaxID=376 RepID=UPI00121AE270|nr:hypothetical protein [Bradyrhizobium sp.]THD70819.1 MAG: hypothetical protein E7813_07345 [Bradyrhizobium sp.]